MTKQEKEQFEKFHDKLDTIGKNVDNLVLTITSDKSVGRVGTAEQTIINTGDITDLKAQNKIRIGKNGFIMGVAGTIFGAVGGFIYNYLIK